MLDMILKMSLVTILYIVLTVVLWIKCRGRNLSAPAVAGIGILYGICSVLSTHFAVDYEHMLLNVRDIGPLAAGLFFHPVSGLIAGLIGGVERFIAGTYWGIGSYTRIACSVSTCLAGVLSVILSVFVLKRRKPSPSYAFILGAAMEVFHMYVVLITHRDDMKMAYYVVKACSAPMILFTAVGLSVSSGLLQVISGEWLNPFGKDISEKQRLSERFQFWMFVVLAVIVIFNTLFTYSIQSQTAFQNAQEQMEAGAQNLQAVYRKVLSAGLDTETLYYTGGSGTFDIIKASGAVLEGNHKNFSLSRDILDTIRTNPDGHFFNAVIFNTESLCRTDTLEDGSVLLTMMPLSEVYEGRDIDTLETAYADILLILTVYIMISLMVQRIVVDRLDRVNAALNRITDGDLDQSVDVRDTAEFVLLSDEINRMVASLKGYIAAAENRFEEELRLARVIQESALPKNCSFPRNDFEIAMIIDPAREVGGDFYDFFFVGPDQLALVIADVSGKGIPASLFMMRSKTMIRSQAEEGKSPSEIFAAVNDMLCEGNDAEMFVTVWIGIIDLKTGLMRCANAGHEYPALMRAGEDFAMYRDKHSLVLAAMPGVRSKEYELQLHPGDKLFVYTDGVPEAVDPKNELYGEDRLIAALNRAASLPMDQILSAVQSDLTAFVGTADQFDDITMLGFCYKGPEPDADTIRVGAAVENLPEVLAFAGSHLEKTSCSPKIRMQIDIAVEELFVNIARYAYGPEGGDVKVTLWIDKDPESLRLEFRDSGKPFDPTEREAPDVTLSAEDRKIGGLGIFMARKYMDDMYYRREDGENILTIRRKLS